MEQAERGKVKTENEVSMKLSAFGHALWRYADCSSRVSETTRDLFFRFLPAVGSLRSSKTSFDNFH